MSALPDPCQRTPLVFPDGTRDPATVFLAAVIDHPNIEVGRYTYYHDRRLPADYAETLAPYLYRGAPERLRIGKFCQIAQGVQFITSTANHPMDGLSTYPFAIFDPPRFVAYRDQIPESRDTVVGNDCWIGRGATLLPGATLGDGVVVGAGAVVGGRAPPFAVIAGNPARVVRKRFPDEIAARLGRLAWWNWAPQRIAAAIGALEAGDIDALEAAAPEGSGPGADRP